MEPSLALEVTIYSFWQLMKAIEVHILDDNFVKDVSNEGIMYQSSSIDIVFQPPTLYSWHNYKMT